MSNIEKAAREIYRQLYPGPICTHDSKRTPESDLREHDLAYEAWDRGKEGYAPGVICRKAAQRLADAGLLAPDTRPAPCHNHKPVQHRDNKPPWCKQCGLTAGGETPLSRADLLDPRKDTA